MYAINTRSTVLHECILPPRTDTPGRVGLHSTIVKVEDKYVLGADLREVIHDVRDALLLDHTAHGDPVLVLEWADRRRAAARREARRVVQLVAGDVVLADDVLARGDDARDARGDQLDERVERLVLRRA